MKFKKFENRFNVIKSKRSFIMICLISLPTILWVCGLEERFEPHMPTFVVGIMTTSGALLAIGLTVLQMLLSDISKSYGPEVQKLIINKNPVNILFSLFVITILASSLIIIMPYQLLGIFMLIITTIFQASLLVFIMVIFDMTKVRNPINNIDFIYDTIIKGMQKDAKK